MIHVVRIWMNNRSNFVIGDDQEAVAAKVSDWIHVGGRVLSHEVIDEPSMGMLIDRRKEDRTDPYEEGDFDPDFDPCVWDDNRIEATKILLFHEHVMSRNRGKTVGQKLEEVFKALSDHRRGMNEE